MYSVFIFRDQPHAWLNCTTGKVVLTYKKHVWLRICLAIGQLMRHGPCQIWFPLTFMQKESQTQFTLWVAYNIVFQGNVVIFVLATEAVSGEDRQINGFGHSVHETVCTWICNRVIGDWKSAGNSSRSSWMRGPCVWRACVYMAGGEQTWGTVWTPRERARV